jgi:multidrug resistance efflux pump
MPIINHLLRAGPRWGATWSIVAIGSIAGWQLWTHYQVDPWTRDGRVRADIVSVTADVAGLVTEVDVENDQPVKRGQKLFVIDRARYQLALDQAEANIATEQAAIAAQQASVAVQQAALAARRSDLAESKREAARDEKLRAVVAAEQIEQSQTKVAELEAAVAQSEAAVTEAEAGLGKTEAALAQARAALGVAELNLARTEVTAPTDGIMSDVELRVGDYVSPGKAAVALIDSASLRVEGYFEETKLPGLHIGQPVEITLMGETRVLRGHIQSIAGAIEDRERGASSDLLPNVNPTFTWVRLAQRVPVRVALDTLPADIRLIAGRTASVAALEPSGVVR